MQRKAMQDTVLDWLVLVLLCIRLVGSRGSGHAPSSQTRILQLTAIRVVIIIVIFVSSSLFCHQIIALSSSHIINICFPFESIELKLIDHRKKMCTVQSIPGIQNDIKQYSNKQQANMPLKIWMMMTMMPTKMSVMIEWECVQSKVVIKRRPGQPMVTNRY